MGKSHASQYANFGSLLQAFSQTPYDDSKAAGTLRMNGKFRKK